MRGESCVSRKMSTRRFFLSFSFFLTLSSSGSWPQKVRIIKGETQKLDVNLQKVSVGTHGTAARGGARCCSTFTIQMFLVMHHQATFTLYKSPLFSFIPGRPSSAGDLKDRRPVSRPSCHIGVGHLVVWHGTASASQDSSPTDVQSQESIAGEHT